MNGDTNRAFALAARRACAAEKHSVTFTSIFSLLREWQQRKPFSVRGTFTVTFGAICASFLPSLHIASYSVAVTSALTGPSTMAQSSAMRSCMFALDFAISDGFVVMPSISPLFASARTSLTSAESIKNFTSSLCYMGATMSR